MLLAVTIAKIVKLQLDSALIVFPLFIFMQEVKLVARDVPPGLSEIQPHYFVEAAVALAST